MTNAAITVDRNLTVTVSGKSIAGDDALVSIRLSRLNAQRVAETLLAFAAGKTTKSAGVMGLDLFPADSVVYTKAGARVAAPVVRLRR